MAMVMNYRPMPKRMRRHADCLMAILALEQELFGEVSPSVKEQYEAYSWWRMAGEPPSASLTPPRPHLPDCGITERR